MSQNVLLVTPQKRRFLYRDGQMICGLHQKTPAQDIADAVQAHFGEGIYEERVTEAETPPYELPDYSDDDSDEESEDA